MLDHSLATKSHKFHIKSLLTDTDFPMQEKSFGTIYL